MRRAWLWFIKQTLNPFTARAARRPGSPFSFVRHVGRRSGRTLETPIIVAPVPEGFVCELTYGPDVDWYRNIVAAGHCELIVGGEVHHVVGVEPIAPEIGRWAFPTPARFVLRLLRRHEFRLLRTAA